jgi:ABC-type multidrug transport system fused ATPase/permease subunit
MFHGGGGGGGFSGGGHGGQGGPGARLHGAIDAGDDDSLGKIYDAKVMRRMPRYMGWVKGRIALGAAGTIIRTGMTLGMPYLVARATDDYILNKNFNGLTIVCLIYVLLSLVMWLGTYMETLHLTYAGQGIIFKLRTQLFDHLQGLSMSFFDRNKVGKLMSRVQNDVDQLQTLMTQDIISLAANVLLLIAIAAVMMTMNLRLALIALTVVPVLALVLYIWQWYARRAFVKVRQAISVVNDNLQESISGVRVTQSMSREKENLKQFDKVNKVHLDANIEAARLQAFMMPTVTILTNIAFALVLVFGGFQIQDKLMQPGVLLAFLLYIQRFFAPVMEIIMMYTEIQRATASGARVLELLDVKSEIEDKPQAVSMPAVKGEISFRDVSFSYDPGKEILHHINLEIHQGETVAIAGRTGAGKSSLTGLIARYYDIDSGELRVDGYRVSEVTQQSLRSQIGIVPQDPFLFSGTVEDNIRYGHLEATHEEIVGAARAAGAHDLILRLEKGYDTAVGERGASLSAGQRQLVCLARAILCDPPIMILDEATSNVDTNTERIMQASLRNLSRGRTVVVIAHRLSTVTHADRIVILDHGNIVETGNHHELMTKQGLYYQMFQTLSASNEEQDKFWKNGNGLAA